MTDIEFLDGLAKFAEDSPAEGVHLSNHDQDRLNDIGRRYFPYMRAPKYVSKTWLRFVIPRMKEHVVKAFIDRLTS